ncbi:MAG: hypothetical protein JW982_14955 [Spirochaetes bacterium]|nr:hypothetical protein [Spirochaetota bacterium]
MLEAAEVFFKKMVPLISLVFLGAFMSWIYYYLKKRDLFGGFIGGMVVGVIGAIVGAFLIDKVYTDYIAGFLNFLNNLAGINIMAGLLGAFLAVFIMNKLNHDKERKKY